MPERQSSPGEATARPETDDTQNDDGTARSGAAQNGAPQDGVPQNGASHHGAPQNGGPQSGAQRDGAAPDGAAQEGAPRSGASQGGGVPQSGAPQGGVAAATEPGEQVAEQVAAAPDATEPAAADPGDGTPAGQDPPQTADDVAALADDEPPAPTPRPRPAPAEASLFEPATEDRAPNPQAPNPQTPVAQEQSPVAQDSNPDIPNRPTPTAQPTDRQPTEQTAADQEAASPPVAPPAARPRPRPAAGPVPPTPGAGAVAAGAAAGTVAAGASATGPAAERPTTDPSATEDDTVEAPVPTTDGPTRPTSRPTPESPTVAVPRPATAPGSGWDSEATQVIPLNAMPARPADPPTERIAFAPTAVAPGSGGTPTPPAGQEAVPGEQPRRRRRPLLVVAALVAVLALLYVGDLLLSSGSVPRGVTVAGVPVGGLSLADAEQELRAAIEPRAQQPVAVTVGEVGAELDPTTSGLSVDWTGTLAQAGEQPLNPFTRIASLFTTRELGVVTTVDRVAVTGALGELGPVVDRLPAEGTIDFEGTTPVAVDPVPGQQLDQEAAIGVLESEWASGVPVDLPLIPLPALTTAEDVATALTEVAEPAVSAPVTVIGEQDTEGTLEPATIAEALSFEPGPEGGLNPVLNPTIVTDALTPQLAGSEVEARDAELNFGTTPPSVTPSQDGRGVDYDATLADLLSVLTGTGPREITAVYADQPAELTTQELEGLGVSGLISEFQTGGFAQDSGQNIRRAAELVNGTVVGPGETFSLDAVTGPRTAANGYVEAGVIDNGQPGRGIAGGVSQVSTTLYNAAYFAGMTDVEHTPHSFYISRYPPGREATIATGAIDMRFRNDTPTAVLIRTAWTPSSVTVQLYGTKYFEVTSAAGPRTNPTTPNTVTIPPGEPCNASNGNGGFTITDTRTMRNLQTGEVTSQTQTTRYNPSPIVVCGQ